VHYEQEEARRKAKKNRLLWVLQLSASLLHYFVRCSSFILTFIATGIYILTKWQNYGTFHSSIYEQVLVVKTTMAVPRKKDAFRRT
jgi:hypothetical protein